MAAIKDPSETEKPEEHIREEALHKASTDLSELDISDVPPDLWFVEAGAIVRADDEEAAKAKVAAAYGVFSDLKDIKVRKPKAAELK